jgi:hypothetical protein
MDRRARPGLDHPQPQGQRHAGPALGDVGSHEFGVGIERPLLDGKIGL